MHSLPIAFALDPVATLHDLLPIVASVAPFIFVICILAIKAIKNFQEQRLRHETVRFALEKGQALPPELLAQPKSDEGPTDDRKAGMILIAVAIGMALFFHGFPFPPDASIAHGVAWLAAIPGLIGVALLINWALNRRNGAHDTRKP